MVEFAFVVCASGHQFKTEKRSSSFRTVSVVAESADIPSSSLYRRELRQNRPTVLYELVAGVRHRKTKSDVASRSSSLASLTDNLASVHISSPVSESVRRSLSDVAENAAVTSVDLPVTPSSTLVPVDVVTATPTMTEEETVEMRGESSSSRTQERRYSPSHRSGERHYFGADDDRGPNNQVPLSGDGALLPPPFHGLPSENPHEWHNYFRRYISYKRTSPEQALELFKVLLRGAAATSFACLEPEHQRDAERVEKWFNDVYKFPPRQKYKVGHQLFTRKQAANETVDEYFAAVQSLARQMDDKPNDDIIRYSLVAGLRPNISGTVMAFAKDPEEGQSVQQLLEAARLAELMVGNTTDSSTIATLVAEVKRLGERIDKPTIAQVNARSTERRVSFSQSPSRRSQSPQPRTPTPDRRYTSSASASYVQPRGSFNNQPRQPRQFQRYGQPTSQPPSQSSSQQSAAPRCNRCGLYHSFNDHCPAFNRQCNYCLKMSHFSNVCRSRMRGYPPAQKPNTQ